MTTPFSSSETQNFRVIITAAGAFAVPTSSASRGEGAAPMAAQPSSATTTTGSGPTRAGSAPADLEKIAKGWARGSRG
jgi:hypothetical protein